ncbi:MAG: ATP-binding protein, partial [Acidobacteria bacterium]|nr:ATP-binding protein [Acidobacteriota bacterium]
TTMGAAVIDPDRIKNETRTLSPIIEKFIADGELNKIKSFDQTFSKVWPPAGPPEAASLELPPGKKRLDIYYTAVSFINPQGIRFRVKLEGYDDDWIDAGGQRNAVYNRLTPGHYTFKVAAGRQNGIWSADEATFSFYLRPYFYQTLWFYIIAVLFVLAAAFSFYHIRVGRLKAREKELNELVKSRTVELETQSVKLKEMDKIKSRFFANISHEFRTPLTLILGPLEQMLTGPREGEKEQKKKIRMMLRNSGRLLGLINQLLELSKFDSGAVKLQATRQNIIPFLKGVLHSFDSLALQKELILEFQTQLEDITLYYDPVRLEEVFANLLSNAVKFTPAGGKITLAVQVKKDLSGIEAQDFLEVLVSDTGPGIPREELAHIFDRFYQADSTYEYHRQGTGIGLAIAREIVELHHGTITAYSGSERSGTLFVIRLPMVSADQGTQEDTSSHSKTSSSLDRHPAPRGLVAEGTEEEEFAPAEEEEKIVNGPGALDRDIILVIEDSADVRQYIRGALEPVYAVVESIDGEQGLAKAKEMVPDLIICDVMMPGKDGFEVCREIKSDRITSHIPVILLTAKAGEENILTGFETGADDYITKPFSTRILSARIKNLIELRRQLQQNFGREMSLQPAKSTLTKIDQEFLMELQKVIGANISDPEFNVDQLNRKMYMSHATLYRKIHALTGETPVEFIRTCRLKKAAELLKAGKGNVGDVAFEVGFSNTSYFIKCFKEKFHQLPSAVIGHWGD